MKNLYNTIEQNLKSGLQVVVKDLENNDYCTLSNLKDSEGNYRMSSWFDSIEEAKQAVGACGGCSKEWWDDFDLEIVEVYRPEYEPFKVGDKVRILDSIKKTGNWEYVEEYFPDMTGEIKEVYFDALGTHYFINGCWYIGHEYLVPLVEQEVEELTMEEVCKLSGRDIKIKK